MRLVVGLAACLVVGELVTRAMEPGPFSLLDRRPFTRTSAGDHRHLPSFQGRWDGTWFATDSLGLRGPELPPPGPGQLRIVCLGDSCTFGHGVTEDECWPRQLESRLTARASDQWRPVVANLGVNGYHGASYSRILDDVGLGLEPDVVLIGFNLNDFPNAIRRVDEAVFQQRPTRRFFPQAWRDTLGHFALYRWARQTFYHLRRGEDWQQVQSVAQSSAELPAQDPAWQRQREILQAIQSQAASAGARTALMLFPYESQVYTTAYDPGPVDRIRALCAELEIPFLDLAEAFRRARQAGATENLFLRGDRYHPGPAGYSIVAQELEALLAAEGWLAMADDSGD